MNPAPSSHYEVGKDLVVTEGQPPNERTIKLHISRLIQPRTYSCDMEVDVLADSHSTLNAGHMILKLYDWRYATELRQEYRADEWTLSHEEKYRAFVEEGGAAEFLTAMDDDTEAEVDTNDRTKDTARDEALLFDVCGDFHSCEVEAYSRLEDLQGRSVPRVFADVRLNVFSRPDDHFQVRGLLLEQVTGYSLEDLAKHSPPPSWQRICDEAIRTVNIISDRGILNEEVEPGNILIRPHENHSGMEAVITTLGHCMFREPDESDAAWNHEKWQEDEEGAIGFEMEQKLKGGFDYKPSYRFFCSCKECEELQ